MEDLFAAGSYDVLVVGAGHAGCEAALAAARAGASTALITMSLDNVALAPCNPSIGGPAKGVVVREIDALGGAMGIITDMSQIQVRLLNTSKGPAVQALRAQIDKKLYQQNMLYYLQSQPNLELKQAEAADLIIKDGRACGVLTTAGGVYQARAVVLTSGTYLNGRVIMGHHSFSSGPAGLPASLPLSLALKKLGLQLARFKTGTPARVDKQSLDFSAMSEQKGDSGDRRFSFISPRRERPNISCWLTYTNEKTHKIIRDHLSECPLYSGMIEGIGPRYCPSIETKLVRFADKKTHQLFLEPEGLHTNEYYVQGLSTSFPENIQKEFLHTIPGLEAVRIIRPAYAIEYDCVLPTQLDYTLQLKALPGLYTAGQINGSSGYEEAAAQGLWAGANAALSVLGKPPFFLSRAQAYIGVMIDDLVTKGVTEPYRLFTSLAEYRLLLRHDNADERLTEYGYSLGLVDSCRKERWETKKSTAAKEEARLRQEKLSPADDKLKALFAAKGLALPGRTVSLWELLARPEFSYNEAAPLVPAGEAVSEEIADKLAIKAKYSGYIAKQERQVEHFAKAESRKLPPAMDYLAIRGLSSEAAQKLQERQPASIGQASRITGVSSADIAVLLIWLEKTRRQKKETADPDAEEKPM